jgi:lysine 6-dehydrogenase
VENGEMITRPALSDREILEFEQVGKLEAFNTDGLRSLVQTMGHIPFMKEKTLRWPGHLDLILALKQAGLFESNKLKFQDKEISPLEFTSSILLDQWKLQPGEEEFTVMKLIIKTADKTIVYDLYDQYDPVTETSSMARTTGYTCTAAVNLISEGLFSEKGVFPPELVGRNKTCFDFIMNYYKERNVKWSKTETDKI